MDVVIQSIIAALIIVAILGVIGFIRFKLDESKILIYLKASSSSTEYTFRGEPAIASDTNLSEDRVHNVCSKSTKITRNKNEKKSWRLAE